MEWLTLLVKVAIVAVALPFLVFGIMIGARWRKQPYRRIKLSFMGASVELGEDVDAVQE